MDYMSELDQMTTTVQAEESSGGRHPLGYFNGIVADIVQKETKTGNTFWSLQLQTDKGTAFYNMFDITPDEVAQSKQDPSKREKLGKQIARYKRHFVDLQVAPAQIVNTWKWSDLLNSIQFLKGKACQVVVKTDMRDPSEIRVFINAPVNVNQPAQGMQPMQANNPVPSQPQMGQVPPMPGSGQSLDQVPF